MKTLYLECSMGAAGDMLMAALLDLVDCKADFLKDINNIGLPDAQVSIRKTQKCGITGIAVDVIIGGMEERSNDAGHSHQHERRTYCHCGERGNDTQPYMCMDDIRQVIRTLAVSEKVKEDAVGIYELIADAESDAHGKPVGQVHFHEVGAMDAVVDIVGVCMLIERLAPERILASHINTGSGHVRCAHGVVPVPAPATERLLRGVPSYSDGIQGELCTPTGAAILKYYADDFGDRPVMTVDKTGYGMGKHDFEKLNAVRVFWGRGLTGKQMRAAEVICNLDDMTGEQLGFAAERLWEAGASDVYTIPVQMKKGRPGYMLCCLCGVEEAEKMVALVLKHTSTFGVRVHVFDRYCLERGFEKVATQYGDVTVKRGTGCGVVKYKSEYEDVKAAAIEHRTSLETVCGEVDRKVKDSVF